MKYIWGFLVLISCSSGEEKEVDAQRGEPVKPCCTASQCWNGQRPICGDVCVFLCDCLWGDEREDLTQLCGELGGTCLDNVCEGFGAL